MTFTSLTTHLMLLEKELELLYHVGQILSRTLDLDETLSQVLTLLHHEGSLNSGMVALLDEENEDLHVRALHGHTLSPNETIRYQEGEGIVGEIIRLGEPVVIDRISDEPRFLGRLGVYDPNLPFIGVPITVGDDEPVGVFTAQPALLDGHLADRASFLVMIANLIAQSVRLSRKVAAEKQLLEEERDSLRREVKNQHGFDGIIGHSKQMRRIFEQVRQVAGWNTTVLLRGESGTGKEVIANAIHYNSSRASKSFIRLNCAALSENLLESELFGHEKGAFTGALSQRKGRFEQADGGTLFLDEIGEISGNFQAKLLRILQEGEFERLGGSKTYKVDVRIIAATNRPLEQMVTAEKFREDLYYRLNVMPIQLPALRERSIDIPELAQFLLQRLAKKQGRPLTITDSANRLLMRHPWPGNVRELENTLERAAIMSHKGVIDRESIVMAGINEGIAAVGPSIDTTETPKFDFNDPNMDERERVIAALEEAGWVQAKAARLLSMTPRQIAYRIQTLNIHMRQI